MMDIADCVSFRTFMQVVHNSDRVLIVTISYHACQCTTRFVIFPIPFSTVKYGVYNADR